MSRIKDIHLSEKTLSEMEMDNILGGLSEDSTMTNNCFHGNCAAGCSIGGSQGGGSTMDDGKGIPV